MTSPSSFTESNSLSKSCFVPLLFKLLDWCHHQRSHSQPCFSGDLLMLRLGGLGLGFRAPSVLWTKRFASQAQSRKLQHEVQEMRSFAQLSGQKLSTARAEAKHHTTPGHETFNGLKLSRRPRSSIMVGAEQSARSHINLKG